MHTFIKIAFRHLWQSRLYASINIIGLAVGITCMLLAVLYWKDEHSFDDFHTANPNLYRITTKMVESSGEDPKILGGTGQVQGPAFKDAVPEVKNYVRIMGGDIFSDVATENKTLHLQPLFVDDNFFDVFSFRLLRGHSKTVLKDVASVVVTVTTAKRFFNSIDVVGRLLKLDADPSFERLGKSLVITGVVADPPANSSLQFDALFPFAFMQLSFEDKSWLNAYLGTFVELNSSADLQFTATKFNTVFAAHAKEQLAAQLSTYGYDPQVSYGLQAMTDIHLHPLNRSNGNAEGGIINGSNEVYSFFFMGIALFILFMATINFINIGISGSMRRAKEVGIRKISGSSKWQIVLQFMYESAILCCMAFLLALIIMNSLLPMFNALAGKHFVFAEIADLELIGYFVGLLAAIICLAGFYPAYVLSNFKASTVLYNKQKLTGRHVFGRSLVVVQFSLAVFLLLASMVYYGQMDFIRTKDLGYNPDQIIRTAVNGNVDYKTVTGFIKNELTKDPSIQSVSFGSDGYVENVYVENHQLKSQYKRIDDQYIGLMELKLRLGRNLSPVYGNDKIEGAIVNEAFVKAAGLQDPIGKRIRVNRNIDSTVKVITGIVKDFHFGSLREPILPMLMYMDEFPDGGIWVKFEQAKRREAMAAIATVYKKALPNAVYQYSFLDELNAKQYMQEQQWQQVISIATVLSFIVCCLGLFGLAHLSTNQRVKEIGIRKVLGATVSQIVALLSLDFLKLVFIAFIVAAPLSWLVMHKWLEAFAYRISIGPAVFLVTAFIAILIALVAVGFQSIKTAIANPVESLRTE